MKNLNIKYFFLIAIFSIQIGVIYAQEIVHAEYFFDTDPGNNNGIGIMVDSIPDLSNHVVSIDILGLSHGPHQLFIRTKDENENWSLPLTKSIFVDQFSSLPKIIHAEYYIDFDPGFGMANIVNIADDVNISDLISNINLGSISSGVHSLYLRSKDEFGVWSLSDQVLFYNENIQSGLNISYIEYYFDTDPGYGLGNSISISANFDINNLSTLINVSGLMDGIHSLFIRSMDENGKWSHDLKMLFLKKESNIVYDIVQIEYYINSDPGYGNATSISIVNSNEIVDLLSLLDMSGRAAGIYNIGIRTKSSKGDWSLDCNFIVYKKDPDHTDALVEGEYYFDGDPGVGMGTNLSFTSGMDIAILDQLDISNLLNGTHEVHIRFKDESNRWTHDDIFSILVKDGVIYPITLGEYYFDTDPGMGFASSFTIPNVLDTLDLDVVVLTSGLPNGLHDLYIRTKESSGNWSLTNIWFDIDVTTVLPLNWLNFDVEKDNDVVRLIWDVTNAFNTNNFDIERWNGKEFAKIGSISSIDDEQRRTYKYVDAKPSTGWNYYRIKQVDIDGYYQYSDRRGIYMDDHLGLVVFPNPTMSGVQVLGLEHNNDYIYQLYDYNYKIIESATLNETGRIDMEKLVKGTYFLMIIQGNTRKTIMIIKS